jgi:NACalpha-BTF3-like transcription factor
MMIHEAKDDFQKAISGFNVKGNVLAEILQKQKQEKQNLKKENKEKTVIETSDFTTEDVSLVDRQLGYSSSSSSSSDSDDDGFGLTK